jgi:hypothetical protein
MKYVITPALWNLIPEKVQLKLIEEVNKDKYTEDVVELKYYRDYNGNPVREGKVVSIDKKMTIHIVEHIFQPEELVEIHRQRKVKVQDELREVKRSIETLKGLLK